MLYSGSPSGGYEDAVGIFSVLLVRTMKGSKSMWTLEFNWLFKVNPVGTIQLMANCANCVR